MTEPERLREEAARCVRLARGISNPVDAQTLRDMANSYLERASKLEAQSNQPIPLRPSQPAAQPQAQQQQQPQDPPPKKEE
jgi:hypothetical protein